MTETDPHAPSRLSAVGIGLVISVVTALLMLVSMKSGISPLPKPLGLAFAETLSGRALPLPVGLLFHTVYVTFWSMIFVFFFRRRTLTTALALAGVLWLGVLVVFFPVVGWGIAGLNVSPKLIPASLVPHLFFGALLWALDKFARRGRDTKAR